MTREPASSRKSAVVLSPEGEIEGHVVVDDNEGNEGVEKISPEREIVYVPYESVDNPKSHKTAAAPNYRSTIILSNLLVAALVALYFHFATSSSDADNQSTPSASQTVANNSGNGNKIDRSDQVDEAQNQFMQPIALIKQKASLIIDDENEDISLVNSFLDSWRDIAPSTKLSFKNSLWFQQFTKSLDEKIGHIRNVSTYNESSQIYAGTLLNLAALLGIQTQNNQNLKAFAATNNIDTNIPTTVVGDDNNSNSELSQPDSENLTSQAESEIKPMAADLESEQNSSAENVDNTQVVSQGDEFNDIVSELSSQIAKLEAEQKNQVEDDSLHKANLVKGSHSVIGNTVKSDSGYSESDLHYLLGQYATTYEFGDANKLLALFSAKPGYRRALKRNFKKVFAYSESRHIEFSDLDWKFYNDSIIGDGKYKATIQLKKHRGTRFVSADIRVEMKPGKQSLKIARLDFSNVRSKTVKDKEELNSPVKKNDKSSTKTTSTTVAHAPIGKPLGSIHKTNSKPQGPTAAELQDIITRFIGAYETGNIKALDNIFSSNARTNDRNNLKEIKSDYKDFFSNTTDRQLFIKDLKWTINKDLAKGIGNLNALVVKTDSDKINAINGEVEIVAQRINNKVLITHLFHNYSVSKN